MWPHILKNKVKFGKKMKFVLEKTNSSANFKQEDTEFNQPIQEKVSDKWKNSLE